MARMSRLLCTVLFLGALVMVGLAIWEKLGNLIGYTLFRNTYTPGRLLEFSAVVVLFVIALQLGEIGRSLDRKGPS